MPSLSFRHPVLLAAAVACLAAWTLRADEADESKPAFPRTTIDVGIVASDLDKSLDFYKRALGFIEIDGFDVPADFATKTGLSDHQPFRVHVLVLGEGKSATRLKLMQFPKAPGKRPDQTFIHSTYGPSYLTIMVGDLGDALNRAAQQGVKPIADGPVPLPENLSSDLSLAIVRDPDGTMIELVGKP